MRKQQWRLGHAPCPLPSPLPHPPPPPRPPATTPQPMGEQQAPHLTRAMADERWRTVSWRMNKNLCLRRPVSEPGPLRMRDCRADHWTTETSCAWRRDMATILLCNIVTKRMKLHNTHVDTYVNPTPDRVWDCPGAYTPRLRHHMVHKVGPEILVVTLRTT
ncbi:hypothetical protein J6590_097990 [Homalodisca vitripennis]|nr:hypothetical protein J6590_097990 [Homalodisca vitripennis]